MVNSELVLGALVALNLALYALLAFVTLGRRRRVMEPSNLVEAFGGLELALREAMPDLPSGFTWEEALARLRSSGVRTEEMEGALSSYEAYRYGGTPVPETDFHGVVTVTRTLGRAPKRRGGAPVGN